MAKAILKNEKQRADVLPASHVLEVLNGMIESSKKANLLVSIQK